MAFEDVNKSVWRGIGGSTSLGLIILSIYDVVAAAWVLLASAEPTAPTQQVTEPGIQIPPFLQPFIPNVIVNPQNAVVNPQLYPGYFHTLTYVWVAAAVLLLVYHIMVFYGYSENSQKLLGICKMGAYIMVVVLVVLAVCYSYILVERPPWTFNLFIELIFMSIFFSVTLITEVVLAFVLPHSLGPEEFAEHQVPDID